MSTRLINLISFAAILLSIPIVLARPENGDVTCNRVFDSISWPAFKELFDTTLNSICPNLDKNAKEYPYQLKVCVCVIFKEESNDLIWSSFGNVDLNKLNSILKATNFNTGNLMPVVDYAYGRYDQRHPAQVVLRQYYDYIVDSIKYHSKVPLSIMALTLKSSAISNIDEATLEQKYQLLENYLRDVCRPLLEDKLLESVWSVIMKLRALTGGDFYSRELLLADDGTMRNLFIERGFCKTAHELNYQTGESQQEQQQQQPVKWIKPDDWTPDMSSK